MSKRKVCSYVKKYNGIRKSTCDCEHCKMNWDNRNNISEIPVSVFERVRKLREKEEANLLLEKLSDKNKG